MEKRVLLAIFLAFLVLYVWQAVFVKPIPKGTLGSSSATSADATSAGAGRNAGENAAASAPMPSTAAIPAEPPPAQRKTPPAEALVTATVERDVRVETRDV